MEFPSYLRSADRSEWYLAWRGCWHWCWTERRDDFRWMYVRRVSHCEGSIFWSSSSSFGCRYYQQMALLHGPRRTRLRLDIAIRSIVPRPNLGAGWFPGCLPAATPHNDARRTFLASWLGFVGLAWPRSTKDNALSQGHSAMLHSWLNTLIGLWLRSPVHHTKHLHPKQMSIRKLKHCKCAYTSPKKNIWSNKQKRN